MLDLVSTLKSVLKQGVVSKTGPDDRSVHGAWCSYLGKENTPFEYIMPYGVYANPPVGTPLILMSKTGVESNLAGIPYGQKSRFKNLKEGEVKLGNPITGSYILFSDNKGMSQYAPKQITVVTDDSYTITCAKDFKVVSQQDVDFTSTVGKNKFNNIRLTGATASRLLATSAANDLISSDLINWVHTSSLTVISDGAGGVNIDLSSSYEPSISLGNATQYWRGDKTWQTLDTNAVAEGTNLYYTDARSRASVSSSITALTYSSLTGIFSLTTGYIIPTTTQQTNWNDAYSKRVDTWSAPLQFSANTASITKADSTHDGYLSSADWNNFNKITKAKSIFIPAETAANFNSRRVRSIAGAGSFRFNFYVPEDFSSLISAYLICFVTAGADGTGKDINISVEYTNAPNQLFNQFTASDTTTVYNLTGYANKRYHLAITSLLANVTAGSEGGVLVDHNAIGGTIHYLGIVLKYSV